MTQTKRRMTMAHRLGWIRVGAVLTQGDHIRPPFRPKPIWVHALSVGEVLSARTVVDALIARHPHVPLVFSASTMAGMAMAEKYFTAKAAKVFYFPYDLIFSVKKVIRQIDPHLLIIVETDIWPNMIHEFKKRSIPVVLINARMSRRSMRGYRLVGGFFGRVLSQFDTIAVQTPEDARRFGQLGAAEKRIHVVGNVKFDQPATETEPLQGPGLRQVIGLNPEASILLAGSTHPGEEELLLNAYTRLKSVSNPFQMILVPRDPARGQSVLRQCRRLSLQAGLLNNITSQSPDADHEVLIVDAIGILRHLYAVADIAFIGGSLMPFGGHNPLEAAAYAKPIVFGPHMDDFKAIADVLTVAQGAFWLTDIHRLTESLSDLLTDPSLRQDMGQRARQVFLTHQGATHRTLNLIAPFVDRAPICR